MGEPLHLLPDSAVNLKLLYTRKVLKSIRYWQSPGYQKIPRYQKAKTTGAKTLCTLSRVFISKYRLGLSTATQEKERAWSRHGVYLFS